MRSRCRHRLAPLFLGVIAATHEKERDQFALLVDVHRLDQAFRLSDH
jgi:hypothetical protein